MTAASKNGRMLTRRPAVLFLCTGNSCRSQMAEAFGKAFGSERFEFCSAGTAPVEGIHPLTLRVMAEIGLDLRGQYPKFAIDALSRFEVRHLITVCDGASSACPEAMVENLSREHWPIADPAEIVGPEAQRIAGFRSVRDEVRRRVLLLLEGSGATPLPMRDEFGNEESAPEPPLFHGRSHRAGSDLSRDTSCAQNDPDGRSDMLRQIVPGPDKHPGVGVPDPRSAKRNAKTGLLVVGSIAASYLLRNYLRRFLARSAIRLRIGRSVRRHPAKAWERCLGLGAPAGRPNPRRTQL